MDGEGLVPRYPSDEVHPGAGLEIPGLGSGNKKFQGEGQMSFDQAGASSGQTRPFTVYCLRSAVSRRTYVGATVDLSRRLRQHNGDLKGGAKYTSSHRPWELAGTVTGFATFREALQFEWRWKKTRVRRSRAIPLLLDGNRPSKPSFGKSLGSAGRSQPRSSARPSPP